MTAAPDRKSPRPCPACGGTILKLKRGSFDQVRCVRCDVAGPMFDGHPESALSDWDALPRRSDNGDHLLEVVKDIAARLQGLEAAVCRYVKRNAPVGEVSYYPGALEG